MRNLLGGKGANLAEMTALGMPVPQGFTITTEACTRYYDDGRTDRRGHPWSRSTTHLAKMEEINGKKFGDRQEPPAGFRAFRRPRFHARHDGHHSEPGPERRGGRRA